MKETFQSRSIPAVLEQHMEELTALLMQRTDALSSAEYSAADFAELDQRIDAHVDGLLVNHDDSLPMLEPAIMGDDPAQVYSAAYVLLRMKNEKAIDLIVKSLLEVEGPEKLDALCRALCDSGSENVPLELLLDAASPNTASVILLALASSGQTIDRPLQVEQLIASDSPETRARAWQIVALLGEEHAV